MARQYDRKLILEDGKVMTGYAFGGTAEVVAQLVFNTSMVGYQEIISDPTNTDLAVAMSYPLIGNYGITDEDFESRIPTVGALIVGEYNDLPSNFRATKTLAEVLEEHNIPGVEGIDTRELTRSIRDGGSRRVLITDRMDMTAEEGMEIIRQTPVSHDAVSRVSCRKRWFARTPDHRYTVVAVDCGIRHNFIRALNQCGCNVTVVPHDTDLATVLSMKPDGLLISNGPGDPNDVPEIIRLIQEAKGKLPIFGIGLGNQLIALSYGAKINKLKFGHHGGNHPVKDVSTGKIEIVAQNHNYVVDADSVAGTGLEITHINMLDGTVEGVKAEADRVFGVQFHPESIIGLRDPDKLFYEFIRLMKEGK